jgi:hypothetical protein
MSDMPAARYRTTLAALERTTRIGVDDQVVELPEPPTPGPLSAEDLDRQLLLGITGAGRLNPA